MTKWFKTELSRLNQNLNGIGSISYVSMKITVADLKVPYHFMVNQRIPSFLLIKITIYTKKWENGPQRLSNNGLVSRIYSHRILLRKVRSVSPSNSWPNWFQRFGRKIEHNVSLLKLLGSIIELLFIHESNEKKLENPSTFSAQTQLIFPEVESRYREIPNGYLKWQ